MVKCWYLNIGGNTLKKLLWIGALSALLLAACGDEAEKETKAVEDTTKEVATEPTQNELNAKLKTEAIPLDFVAANGDEIEKDTKVTITGEVTSVMSDGVGGKFTVTTTEDDGFGVFSVTNLTLDEVVEGQTVNVYGTFSGKDESSTPSITATFIE